MEKEILVLQSIDDYDKLALVNTNTNVVDYISRQIHSKPGNVVTQGVYSLVDNHFVGLYRKGNELYLQFDERKIYLNSILQAEIIRRDMNIFRVRSRLDHSIVFETTYTVQEIYPPLELDPTPFIEAEDFDIFLLAHNIINNSERMKRAFV